MEKSTYFTDRDAAQIEDRGQSIEDVERQMDNFRHGFPYLDIDRAARTGDGIFAPDPKGVEHFTSLYRKAAAGKKIVKFVPASGAATRMFRDLFAFADSGELNPGAARTLANIDKFAFYNTLRPIITGLGDRETALAVLNYGADLPKGLILFHRYGGEVRTAVEEHLVEGAQYAASDGQVRLHFTVSPQHENGFRMLLDEAAPHYQRRFGVRYDISFSRQEPSTDTIAVTPDNEPFRDKDGSLLFRPAGHGALIGNLDAIDADIIFIKNIDNVTTDRLRADTIVYKHVIGGMLLSLQEKVFNYLALLDRRADTATLENIREFVEKELCYQLPSAFGQMDEARKAEYLRGVLDRPIRVCAMVRNEGEPGGGPFWVANPDGSKSLQIGEMSQVDPTRKSVFMEGTHFNPVDIVCGVKDYRGEKYDLGRFTDPQTGFISEKSKDGRPLKAQELPGLWNGAMARWNTVFVEAPISTFTPVKEVNDLLRPAHQ